MRLEVPTTAAPFIDGMHTLSGVGDVTFMMPGYNLRARLSNYEWMYSGVYRSGSAKPLTPNKQGKRDLKE